MKNSTNMDQKPFPFVMEDGKTHADRGSSEVVLSVHFN